MNNKSTVFTAQNMLLITYLTGGAIAVLGCLILAGWYLHNLTILQLNHAFVPMQFNTALGFLASGASLCLVARGRYQIAVAVATIAGLLGLLTCMEYSTGMSLNIDQLFMRTYVMATIKYPGRMAPSTAFCFLLSWIAILCAWRGAKNTNLSAVGLIGSVIAGLGIIGTLGYFTNLPTTYIWANFSSMALHTAIAFIFLGIGLVAHTLESEMRRGVGSGGWRAGAVGLATFTVFIGATQAMLAGEENAFRSKSEVIARAETNKLRATLALHMQAIERMAERAEVRLPGQVEWTADASRYVEHANGIYNTIEWLDPSYQIRWKVVSDKAIVEPINFENVSALFDPEKQRDKARLIQTTSANGRTVFLIVAPIVVDSDPNNGMEGLIVAVIDPVNLFNKMQIVSESAYDFTIKNGSEVFFTSKKSTPDNKIDDIAWVQSANGSLGEVEWEMDVWPVDTHYSVAPWFILIAGVLSASALMILVLKSQAVNARLRELLTIIDTAPIGMLVLDSAGNVRQVNMEGEKLFGYTRDEIYGAQAKTLIHDLLNHELTKYTDSFVAQPAKCRRKDGSEVFTEVGINHILIDEQEHILVVVTDISQRKHAETELEARSGDLMQSNKDLKQLQQLLQTTIDHMPALVGSWDLDFRNRFGNKAYIEWFDITPAQMYGKYMWDIIGKDRFAKLKPKLMSVLEGNSEVFELAVTLSSGEVRHGVFSYVPDIENGVVKGYYGFVSDVTPLKQAQIAKDNVLAQLQDIIDAAKEFAIIESDEKGIVTLFSRGAEILLGYLAEEIVGKVHIDHFHLSQEAESDGTPAAGSFNAIVDLVEQEESSSFDCIYVHKDGTHLLVNLTVAKVHDKSGNTTGYLGIAKDIRKEKEILHALADARDKAQSANRAKSQFLANMSHELRTPMNAILGMLQLLQRTNLSARQLDYSVKSQSAAQALLGLLNDILDFSKVEAGKLLLENAPFRLDNLMRDLSVIFSSNVGEKEIDLLFSIDPRFPPCVLGDEMRLRQVLINLAGNAIKFTQRGSVIVSLQVVAQDDKQSTITFSVQDTGIGIGPEQLNYVFEGFSQAEASTTRRFGGTGLGLAISRRLVALMGGNIEVESSLNSGSRFYFSLTLLHTDFDVEGKPAVLPMTKQQHRVLIVDDSAQAREILHAMIDSLGWQGEVADNGESALEKLKHAEDNRRPYDLVFMDWKMPGMDGLQTAAEMRQCKRSSATPIIIIMVTAHDREILAKQLKHDSTLLDGFLVKPVTASMLYDAVANVKREPESANPKQRDLRLTGKHLLVVEDNLINQEVARELLKSEGATVEVANDGREGVDRIIAGNTDFDAILMDIQMPVMDGYEATKAIRQLPNMQALPIIATTANAMASDKEAARVAGMNDHVAKPIDIDELVNAILRCCINANFTTPAKEKLAGDAAQTPTPKIEIDEAIKRLGGNTGLFNKLLVRFKQEATDLTTQLRQHLDGNEADKALQAVHTLKGLAGTVGATGLAQFASAIEMQLKSGQPIPDLAPELDQLDALAAQSCAALDAANSGHS